MVIYTPQQRNRLENIDLITKMLKKKILTEGVKAITFKEFIRMIRKNCRVTEQTARRYADDLAVEDVIDIVAEEVYIKV